MSKTDTRTVPSQRRAVPAGRTGKAVRPSSRLRRVYLRCHGWVRDGQAQVADHVWCEKCADWARVIATAD